MITAESSKEYILKPPNIHFVFNFHLISSKAPSVRQFEAMSNFCNPRAVPITRRKQPKCRIRDKTHATSAIQFNLAPVLFFILVRQLLAGAHPSPVRVTPSLLTPRLCLRVSVFVCVLRRWWFSPLGACIDWRPPVIMSRTNSPIAEWVSESEEFGARRPDSHQNEFDRSSLMARRKSLVCTLCRLISCNCALLARFQSGRTLDWKMRNTIGVNEFSTGTENFSKPF